MDAAFLDRLRGRVTLSQLVSSRTQLHKKGRLYYACCPFHKEKTPSFKVDDERGNYHCFGCHVSGDAITFVMETENLPFMGAVERLADMVGLELPREEKTNHRVDPSDRSLELIEKACAWYESLLQGSAGLAAKEYALSRGLTHASIKHYRLGYSLPDYEALKKKFMQEGYGEAELVKAGLLTTSERRQVPYDRFRGRLMFPIQDAQGHVVGFGARSMDGGEPKYLNSAESPWFQKGDLLYGQFQAKQADRQLPFIVTEGYLDVISLVQTGRYRSVAPLGTAITETQISKLFRFSPEPILCFDGDTAGQRAMDRAADRAVSCLRPGCFIHFAHLPQGEDPDSLVQKGAMDVLAHCFEKPTPLVDALWESLMKGVDLTLPERRAELKKNLDRHVVKIQDPDIRTFYQQEYQSRLRRLTYGVNKGRGPMNFSAPKGRLRMGHQDRSHTQREILLAAMVTHPQLLDAREESFAQLTFSGDLDRLHTLVLKLFHEKGGLTPETLRVILEQRGMADLANDLVNRVYLHAPFVREDAPEAETRDGWDALWSLYQVGLGGAQQEQELRLRLEEHWDVETWDKLKRLQQAKQVVDDF